MSIRLHLHPNTDRQHFRVSLREVLPNLDDGGRDAFLEANQGSWQPWDAFTPWIRCRYERLDGEPHMCLAVETTMRSAPLSAVETAPDDVPPFASASEDVIDADFGAERIMPLTYLPNGQDRDIDVDIALVWLRPDPGAPIDVDVIVVPGETDSEAALLESWETREADSPEAARRACPLAFSSRSEICDHGPEAAGEPPAAPLTERIPFGRALDDDTAAEPSDDPFGVRPAGLDAPDCPSICRAAHTVLEAALAQVNTQTFRAAGGAAGRGRRLRDVRIVFPGTWSDTEREQHLAAWQRAIDLFAEYHDNRGQPLSLRPALEAACCAHLRALLDDIGSVGDARAWLDLVGHSGCVKVLSVLLVGEAADGTITALTQADRGEHASVIEPRALARFGLGSNVSPGTIGSLLDACGRLVGDHDVNLVLIGGTAADLPDIRERVIESLPLLPQRIVTPATATPLEGALLLQDIANGRPAPIVCPHDAASPAAIDLSTLMPDFQRSINTGSETNPEAGVSG